MKLSNYPSYIENPKKAKGISRLSFAELLFVAVTTAVIFFNIILSIVNFLRHTDVVEVGSGVHQSNIEHQAGSTEDKNLVENHSQPSQSNGSNIISYSARIEGKQIEVRATTLHQGGTLLHTLAAMGLKGNQPHLVANAVAKIYKVSNIRGGASIKLILFVDAKQKNDQNIKSNLDHNNNVLFEHLSDLQIVIGNQLFSLAFSNQNHLYTARKIHEANNVIAYLNSVEKQFIVGSSPARNIDKNTHDHQKSINDASNSKNKVEPNIAKLKVSNSSQQSKTNNHHKAVKGVVTTGNLADAIKKAGAPAGIVREVMSLLSGSATINKNTEFEIVYTSDAKISKNKISYIGIKNKKIKTKIYKYEDSKKRVHYLYHDGYAIKKAVNSGLRAPVRYTKISSGYGFRIHPIWGTKKFHGGVDYKAPHGTPIVSAGDGIIVSSGYEGGYGRSIKVRHDNKYSTFYAHLSRIAQGIRVGSKITKGQVIGYVGSSGNTTGAHLHFELHENGKRVNPHKSITLASKPIQIVSGPQLIAFKTQQNTIDAILKDANNYQNTIPNPIIIAMAD